jgi:hypothetical protein
MAALRKVDAVSWLLLDYGGPSWFNDAIPYTQNDDRAAIFRTDEPQLYNHSHAKNAAVAAAGRAFPGLTWVCNLDADNYVNVDYVERLLAHLRASANGVARSPRTAAGRIACSLQSFGRVRGYDERFRGWGAEDCDFIHRVLRLGCHQYRALEDSLPPVEHGKAERMSEMQSLNYDACYSDNMALYRDNKRRRATAVNPAGYGVTPFYRVQ